MLANFLKEVVEHFTLTLLYRGTRDLWTADFIHHKIDNQGPTVTIYLTTLGKIFGGFTTVSWDKSGIYKQDK